MFVHSLIRSPDRETELTDSAVGGDNHSTNSWRKGEIVFDVITLPGAAINKGDRLRIGLYDLENRNARSNQR